ncbi:MAG: peptidylprolyl isomerase [Ichthyobacteriaceae bacterium]|nr:peptidylprolyl isomerase [Ichthyobacteriaceae bacterium]
MAALNQIRAKSGWLIVIIGFALFAFVLGDLVKSGTSIMNGNRTVVGVIDGKEISYQEFNPEVKRTLDAYKRQGLNSTTQASNIAWNNMEQTVLVDNEIEKLGINIGEEELWDLIINDASIQNAPSFKNAAGTFDENKVKEYLAYLRQNAGSNAQAGQLWYDWVNFEKSLKERSIVNNYYNLIKAGISATDVEGETEYKNSSDKVSAKYVYLPYSGVDNKDVKVSDSEIKSYISNNQDEFKADASRDIQYVFFALEASLNDEQKAKEEVEFLIKDREEFNNSTKSNDVISGFKNTTEDSLFVSVKSDVRFDSKFYHEGALTNDLNKFAFAAKVGDIYGPYKDGNAYAVSKLIDTKVMPDSVKASHILISYKGSQSAKPETTRTIDEAKNLADSLANVLNKTSSKFVELATDFSEGPTATKGGDLGWFTNGTMVPEFNQYAFANKKGSIGVVKTVFGYHVIKIEDQKNIAKAVKLATIVRNIVISDDTDNDVYNKASAFNNSNKDLASFGAAAQAKSYQLRNVEGLTAMDYNIPGIGDQREIIRWAFNEDTKIEETKLKSVENGYLVAMLTNKSVEGLKSVDVVRAQVEPLLINEKKAAILEEKLKGKTLDAIAASAKVEVKTANSISFSNPVLAGAGREPKVVGEMFGMKKNVVSEPIEGKNGVYVVEVTEAKSATDLSNYASYTKKLEGTQKSSVNRNVVPALRNSVQITDNRAKFY